MGINFKDVGAKAVSKAAELLFRQNQSMEDENGSVGAGLLAIHEDRAAQKINVKREKEERKSKAHRTLMTQINDRIKDLKREAAQWGKIADDLEDKLGGLDSIGEKSGTERNPNESDEDYEKRVIADTLALVAAGLLDPNSDQALWAVARDRENQILDTINDIENTADPVEQMTMIEAASTDVAYKAARISENLKEIASNEFNDRKDQVLNEHDIIATDEMKESISDSFLGDDLFLEAEKLEISDNFARAASGEIQLPKPEQETTPQDPSQQISLSV